MIKIIFALGVLSLATIAESTVETCFTGSLNHGSSMMQPVETVCLPNAKDACLKISTSYGTAVSYSCATASQCKETVHINGYPGLSNCCYKNNCNSALNVHLNKILFVVSALFSIIYLL